jgi:4-amino-4-deoxy-L-arabinose transferase-like glycosyltransferase
MRPVNDQTAIDSPPRAGPPQRAPMRRENAILSPAGATAIIAVVTLIGAGVRLHHLAGRSLWIDEAASVHFATIPWWPFLRLLWGYQGNMTLYYFALRAWMHWGDSEFVVRGLSALFGILTIPSVYALGKRLFDRPTGLIAAALLSVHRFHVAFSQEARGYSLLLFLLVLTTYALIVAMESDQRLWRWILFAITAALCVYAHIFAVLALAAHMLAIVFPRPFRVRSSTVAVTTFLFGFLVVPMAAFVLLHHSDQINWVPQPALSEIFEFLQLLTSQGGILLIGVYLALCGLAFWHSDRVAGSDKENWALRLLALWLVLPPALTIAASAIKPIFYPRYMVMCVPALVMLAARGIVRLSCLPAVKYWAAAAALALVLTLSAWGTHQYFVNFTTETSDWRSAVGYILQRQQPGDGIIFYIPNDYAYLYYTRRAETQHEVTEAPDILYPPEPWRPLSRAEVKSDISGRKRVWLVLHIESLDPEQPALIQSTLEERLRLQDKKLFPGQDLITVELFSERAAAR